MLVAHDMMGADNTLVWYVDNAREGNDGTSWEKAFKYLYTALAEAAYATGSNKPQEIWVAGGGNYYYPTSEPSARNATFQLPSDIALYGGFKGNESSLAYRDPDANPTILSGDIKNTPDDASDDCYHIVTGTDGIILDGFTIQDSNAIGNSSGGGMIIYPCTGSFKVENCTFQNNRAGAGGGIFIGKPLSDYQTTSSSYPHSTIKNCKFINNTGASGGGGIYCYNSNISVTNCLFSGNKSYDHGWPGGGAIAMDDFALGHIANCFFINNKAHTGGAISNNYEPHVFIEGCVFAGNHAYYEGGAIMNYFVQGTTMIINCTFTGNTSDEYGGAMHCNSMNVEVEILNSIFWDNIILPKNWAHD